MYDELVKELRVAGDFVSLSGYQRDLMRKAADAIEERNNMERDFRQYISDQVNRTKGVYACCFCRHGTSNNNCKKSKCDGVSDWEYGTPKDE